MNIHHPKYNCLSHRNYLTSRKLINSAISSGEGNFSPTVLLTVSVIHTLYTKRFTTPGATPTRHEGPSKSQQSNPRIRTYDTDTFAPTTLRRDIDKIPITIREVPHLNICKPIEVYLKLISFTLSSRFRTHLRTREAGCIVAFASQIVNTHCDFIISNCRIMSPEHNDIFPKSRYSLFKVFPHYASDPTTGTCRDTFFTQSNELHHHRVLIIFSQTKASFLDDAKP